MRLHTSLTTLFTSSLLLATASANISDVLKRASPQAPDGYAPAPVDCPSTRPSIRTAGRLSDQESEWLDQRRPKTITALRDLLGRLDIDGFDADSYFQTHSSNSSDLPNIGIAMSGGGYRALMNGAGAVAAFDNRTPNSTSKGHLGGLLQSATYFAGLSGGGWLVGSLYSNNFTSVQSIMDTNPDHSGSLWQFDNSILEGPDTGGIQLFSTAGYYDDIVTAVNDKTDAGFNTSLTDLWGRALSFQLINATQGGPAYTFSSIADDWDFKTGNAPMPILIANGRAPGERIISLNTTVYEFNPFEMGSWDPTVYGFAPMKFVGSNFTDGELSDNEDCIAGFDNAGYIMGTSSTLFNQFLLNLEGLDIPEIFRGAIQGILEELDQDSNDIADWTPNPFFGFNPSTNPNAESKRLTLVDGGEDLQNIPLHPLIQPYRHVDVIFAVDSSADTIEPAAPNWPNGTALVATFARLQNETMENGTVFPAIPDQNTFVNLGLNNRPTFFGCDEGNLTGPSPIVVYIPNAPYVFKSNVSTFDLSTTDEERNAIIQNGYNVATQGNSTRDAEWPACVGCAILARSLNRTNTDLPEMCTRCFDRYCWDGTINSTDPNPYFPETILAEIQLDAGLRNMPSFFVAVAALAAGFILAM
ncbi:lysophospholipase [Patellaria atrata CBS 101060]|uniref:Lysophospholipase n=1 Tax=Patellaria atrata CBS 101060 TaxID=1346257 RepID=A0A9P4S7C3_9PEZI|nr:lysophospholipase [Patellaria atrata CBS 101060]